MAHREIADNAQYLRGMADGMRASNPHAASRLSKCAEWMDKAAYYTCRAGFVGCDGGDTCSSDHK